VFLLCDSSNSKKEQLFFELIEKLTLKTRGRISQLRSCFGVSKILGLGQFGLGPADKTNFGLTPFLLGATGSGKKTSSGKFSTNPKRPAERRRRLLVASWVVDQRQ
jgi:hypothetical protein